jgi:hypothetical protein
MRKKDIADHEAEQLFDLVQQGRDDDYIIERIAISLRRAILMPQELRSVAAAGLTGPTNFDLNGGKLSVGSVHPLG